MIFLVIGRTAEIVKAGGLAVPDVVHPAMETDMTTTIGSEVVKRAEISTSLVNAGTAISELLAHIIQDIS